MQVEYAKLWKLNKWEIGLRTCNKTVLWIECTGWLCNPQWGGYLIC